MPYPTYATNTIVSPTQVILLIFSCAGDTIVFPTQIGGGMPENQTKRFVGRHLELERLTQLTKKKIASLVVIKGRRRIGKSRLIEEFAQGKTFYHFAGLAPTEATTAKDQLDSFSNQLHTQINLPKLPYDDWQQVFAILAEQIKTEPAIVLFDEISWMGSRDSNFLGKLKNAWDMYYKKNPHLILILCGSVSQWIEENILASTGFFGRIAYELTLDELPLNESNQLLTAIGFNGSNYEKMMLFAITGGVPWYIENIQPGLSAVENIKQLCFQKNGLLVNEYEKIFHDLFSSRGTVRKRIVEYLADGPKEYSVITIALDYPSGGSLSKYLDELVTSGFITQDYTWSLKTGRPIKRSQYRLSDNYLRFYLKYIAPKLHQINKNQYTEIAISALPGWNSIIGLQFENLVINNKQLIQKHLNLKAEDIINEGPFFQRQTTRQKGCQVDYLIQTRHKTLYACEIKFSRNPLGVDVIQEVKQKLERISMPRGYACHPVLIHMGDVSQTVVEQNYFYAIIDFTAFISR